jgi:hypothetical protein
MDTLKYQYIILSFNTHDTTHSCVSLNFSTCIISSQLHIRQQDVEPKDVHPFLSMGDMLNFMAQVTIVHRTGVACKVTNHKSLHSN